MYPNQTERVSETPASIQRRIILDLGSMRDNDRRELVRQLAEAERIHAPGCGVSSNGAGNAIHKLAGEDSCEASAPARGLTLENVERCFTYQAWNTVQIRQAEPVREAIVALAKAILRHVPDSADRSVALRKLRELRMDVNAAITHRGEF